MDKELPLDTLLQQSRKNLQTSFNQRSYNFSGRSLLKQHQLQKNNTNNSSRFGINISSNLREEKSLPPLLRSLSPQIITSRTEFKPQSELKVKTIQVSRDVYGCLHSPTISRQNSEFFKSLEPLSWKNAKPYSIVRQSKQYYPPIEGGWRGADQKLLNSFIMIQQENKQLKAQNYQIQIENDRLEAEIAKVKNSHQQLERKFKNQQKDLKILQDQVVKRIKNPKSIGNPSMYKVMYEIQARKHQDLKMTAAQMIKDQTKQIEFLLNWINQVEGHKKSWNKKQTQQKENKKNITNKPKFQEIKETKNLQIDISLPQTKLQQSESRPPYYFKQKSEAQIQRQKQWQADLWKNYLIDQNFTLVQHFEPSLHQKYQRILQNAHKAKTLTYSQDQEKIGKFKQRKQLVKQRQLHLRLVIDQIKSLETQLNKQTFQKEQLKRKLAEKSKNLRQLNAKTAFLIRQNNALKQKK